MTWDVRYQEASLLTGRPWVNDGLSEAMRNSLVEIVRDSGERIRANTLKALKQRELVDNEGSPTQLGKTLALISMPLKEQCQRIGIGYEEKRSNGKERPELRALSIYQDEGWEGAACEGGTILTLMKAASFPALIRWNRSVWHPDSDPDGGAASFYFEAQLGEDNVMDIASEIMVATEDGIRNAFSKIYRGYITGQYFGLNAELLINLLEAIGRYRLKNLVLAISKDPYKYRKGWPDLTLVRDLEVRFVEVKTTDRLHASQLITIPHVANILGHELFSVLRLKK